MIKRVEAEEFIKLAEEFPMLDVRSPGEFQAGHIPGANSFPLFTDTERAEIGTLYKQVSKEDAVSRGLEFVEPKLKIMYAEGIAKAVEGKLLVHCWRGGKRSESVAWLLSLAGIEIYLLNGGYKNFRRFVLEQFEKKYHLIVVGGKTGSGKTEVLHELKLLGEDIMDLEFHADHKGSAFGRLGATREVTQAQFENDIAMELCKMKGSRIWIEDESRNIGKLVIPEPFWKQMRNTRVLYIDLKRAEQVKGCLRTYGFFPKELLAASILKVSERLGGLRTQEALDANESGDQEKVVNIMLDYYDKSYEHGLSKRDREMIKKIYFEDFDAKGIARNLLLFSKA